MRVVVTGGAGFLGSHLVDRLLVDGHRIIIIDNLITGAIQNIAHLGDDNRVEFFNADISLPITVDGEVDYVFNFAGPASPEDFKKYPIQVMKVGGIGTYHALGLAKAKGAK